MKTNMSIIIISFLLMTTNCNALVASDVDMSNAISDITLIVMVVINISLVLLGYRKVLSLIGRG